MDSNYITILISSIPSVIVGYIIANILFRINAQKKSKQIIDEAKKTSEQLKKDKILQAKEKFLELKTEHEKVINERNRKI